jgi:hypothetical protein
MLRLANQNQLNFSHEGEPGQSLIRARSAPPPPHRCQAAPLPGWPGSSALLASKREVGHRVVFDRNPDYPPRAEPPDGAAGARVVKVDHVEWDIIPDPTTAANALVTGEADFWDTSFTRSDPLPQGTRHHRPAHRLVARRRLGAAEFPVAAVQ